MYSEYDPFETTREIDGISLNNQYALHEQLPNNLTRKLKIL